MKSGKWYWEAHLIVQENGFNIGVVKDTESATSGTWNYTKTNFYAINGIGTSYVSDGAGGQNSAGTSFAQGDVVQVAYDADTGKLYFGKNGTWLNSADPAAGTGNLETTSDPEYGYHPVTSTIGDASGYSDVIMNFGQDSTLAGGNTDANGIGDFAYAPPSGFLALCTSNLPDPAIDPAQESSPADYFSTVLYTGTSTTNSVTGVGFQPDFVWIKDRSVANAHAMFDVVRGTSAAGTTNTAIGSNRNDAEGNGNGVLSSFNTDGFTVDDGSSGSFPDTLVNDSPDNYVAWNWKAGTSFSNSAGTNGASIASSGSANTDSGFSIVSYTGDSTGTDGTASTVYHGLSQAPEMIMFKPLDTYDGAVYHSGLTSASYRLILFSASGTTTQASDNGFFNGTAPTSSVFSIGSRKHTNSNGGMIAYCFHSVEGFSKFGSYTGNGNADGPFVYTGFRPAFVMTKKSSGTSNWNIIDDHRPSEYNPADNALLANAAYAETIITGNPVDLLSNGFKIRTTEGGFNTSGQTYIYMAFAENPFKYSNAR